MIKASFIKIVIQYQKRTQFVVTWYGCCVKTWINNLSLQDISSFRHSQTNVRSIMTESSTLLLSSMVWMHRTRVYLWEPSRRTGWDFFGLAFVQNTGNYITRITLQPANEVAKVMFSVLSVCPRRWSHVQTWTSPPPVPGLTSTGAPSWPCPPIQYEAHTVSKQAVGILLNAFLFKSCD